MKVTVIPTDNAPTHYSFDGETVTAHFDNGWESFDLSGIEAGGQFGGVEPDDLTLNASQIIRDAYRDEAGELHVTLCQAVGPGHWVASEEMDASEYVPDKIHVVQRLDRDYSGHAWALTRRGKLAA